MFDKFKAELQARFALMAKHELFKVDLEKNALFEAYLAAIPEDERQSNNCNCCKTFLNQYGGVVAINGTDIMTLWDFKGMGEYKDVPAALNALVTAQEISAPFVTTFAQLGTDSNMGQLSDGSPVRWKHMAFKLPTTRVSTLNRSVAATVGDRVETKNVFQRGLEEITLEAIDEVLGLIDSNTLYRGAEFRKWIATLREKKVQYAKLKTVGAKSAFAWANAQEGGKIRNSSIGTLLVDLSKGIDLEVAVGKFESIMAPANYKRTTALITPAMVSKAKDKITDLGCLASINRRHATKDDIPLEHSLFVRRSTVAETQDVFAQVNKDIVVTDAAIKKAKKISLADFVKTVLPKTSNLELYLEAGHNFMSLIAGVDKTAPSMFSWGNDVSWTYQNNMTDVIREKVKAAGGRVEGAVRISLEWFNFDDLDLHVVEPNGNVIYYARKISNHGGHLDVDMNAGGGNTREPVENIIFGDGSKMQEGKYIVRVFNFNRRETKDLGFNVEIESNGAIHTMALTTGAPSREYTDVATFNWSRREGMQDFNALLAETVTGRDINGLKTRTFQKVTNMLYSPNHWVGEHGNKHLFVILEGAKINEPLRPFFNEYLKKELNEHRKVFEVLANGSNLMVQPTDEQMTGVGLSLTQSGHMTFKADGKLVTVEF